MLEATSRSIVLEAMLTMLSGRVFKLGSFETAIAAAMLPREKLCSAELTQIIYFIQIF